MGFRFRKSIKILPGLRLNLSKGGVSASVGVSGATVNIGQRGTRATVSLPGSGLSYSENLSEPRPLPQLQQRGERPTSRLGACWVLLALGACLVLL